MSGDFLTRAVGRADLRSAPADAENRFHIIQKDEGLETDKHMINKTLSTFSIYSRSAFEPVFVTPATQSSSSMVAPANAAARECDKQMDNVDKLDKANGSNQFDLSSRSPKEMKNGKCGKIAGWPSDLRDWFEERSAIREFDGEMSRSAAEAAALEDVLAAIRAGQIVAASETAR